MMSITFYVLCPFISSLVRLFKFFRFLLFWFSSFRVSSSFPLKQFLHQSPLCVSPRTLSFIPKSFISTSTHLSPTDEIHCSWIFPSERLPKTKCYLLSFAGIHLTLKLNKNNKKVLKFLDFPGKTFLKLLHSGSSAGAPSWYFIHF